MPIALCNVILAVAAILAAHWQAWFYFGLSVDSDKAILEAATGGVAGGVIALLPEANKALIRDKLGTVIQSSKTTVVLAGWLCAALLVAALYAKTIILLPASTQEVSVNGTTRTATVTSGKSVVEVFGLSFSSIEAQLSDLHKTASAWPFFPSTITFSENEANTHVPLYREVQDDLLLTFYQYFVSNYLSQANADFSTPDGQHFQDLNRIYLILRKCYVDVDLNGAADAAIETYSAEHPQSFWIPLLKSCILYSRREYDKALYELKNIPDTLPVEFKTTYLFFRGINQLKNYSSKISEGAGTASGPDKNIVANFDAAFAAATGSGVFFDVARQSSLIFKGISCVYLSQLDTALTSFGTASQGPHPGLRSRAYNDIGYVYMVKGDLPAAENAFDQALEIEGTFPMARINLAYAQMALGKYDSARLILNGAANDPVLRQESFRDTLLAKAGLAHLAILTGNDNPVIYDDLMNSMKLFKFEDESNKFIRLAKIHHSLASNLYTGKDYYGLEIFSMAMEALAFLEAEKAIPDHDAQSIRTDALENFMHLKALVSPTWFIHRNDLGLFSPIYKVLDANPS